VKQQYESGESLAAIRRYIDERYGKAEKMNTQRPPEP
jgi:hypothetical protein